MKYLLTILLLVPFIGIGQGWIKYFPAGNPNITFLDGLSEIDELSEGGFIFGRRNLSIQDLSWSIELIKLDEIGDTIWTKIYSQSSLNGTQVTLDGGFLLCGSGWYMKTNSDGDSLWSDNTPLNNQSIHSIIENEDGNYTIVYNNFGSNVTIIKADENLSPLVTYECSAYMRHNVTEVDDKFYLIDESPENSTRIIKLGTNGIVWQFTQDYLEQSEAACASHDGGLITVGGAAIPSPIFPDDYEDWGMINKINQNGDIEWQTLHTIENWTIDVDSTLYQSQHVGFLDVDRTNDGGYIITGYALYDYELNDDEDTNVESRKLLLLKVDQNGEKQWRKTFGIDCADCDTYGVDVKQTIDGGYIVIGYEEDGDDNRTIVIKTDENGNTASLNELNPNTSKNLIKIVDMMGRETSFKPNTPLIYVYDDGSTEKVFTIE